MVNLLISSSVFILLVIGLRKLFHKQISRRIQYMLWLIVALKLLVFPVPSVESALSIFNIVNQMAFVTDYETESPVAGDEKENSAIGAIESGEKENPGVGGAENSRNTVENSNEENTGKTESQMQNPIWQQDSRQKTEGTALKIVWMIGSCIFFGYWVYANGKFSCYLKKHRRKVEPVDGAFPFEIKLQVFEVKELISPCLYGNAIYVTTDCIEDETMFKHVLAHEYSHYKQGDLLWSVVRALCLTIYWWHPLVWVAAYLSKQDCELACDEAALKLLGEAERLNYGKTLLSLITVKSNPKDYFTVTTTMTTGKNSLKQRITAIAKKPRVMISVCILVIVAVVLGFIATTTTRISAPDELTINEEKNNEKETGEQLINSASVNNIQADSVSVATGTYLPDETEDELRLNSLTVDAEEKTLVFPVDPFSSYIPFCSYSIEGNRLKAVTDDMRYHYTFEIVDEETLKFLAGESSDPIVIDERLYTPLYEGAILRLSGTEQENMDESYTREEILSWFDGTGEPAVDTDAAPVWSTDGVIYYLPVKDERLYDLQAFLSEYFEPAQVDILMQTKVGEYLPFQEMNGVLYRGLGLVGNDDIADYSTMSGEELQQLAEEGIPAAKELDSIIEGGAKQTEGNSIWEGSDTLELYVYHISSSTKAIDLWAFNYHKYEEEYYLYYNLACKNGEIQTNSFYLDDNTKYYVNETVGNTESTEVEFDTFAEYINSRSDASEEYGYEGAECLCELKDGVVVSIVLQNPYPGISNLTTVPEDHYRYENYGVGEYYPFNSSRKAKLNHDADNTATDLVEVFTGNVGDGDSGMVLVYSGYPANEPYSIEAHTARAGWTNIYLVNIDGKDYIFQLNIDCRDGSGECSYYLYYFGEKLGTKLAVYLADGAAFSYKGEIHEESYDKWAEKMNSYLKDAVLLLSTQNGEVRTEPVNDYDRYNKDALLKIM